MSPQDGVGISTKIWHQFPEFCDVSINFVCRINDSDSVLSSVKTMEMFQYFSKQMSWRARLRICKKQMSLQTRNWPLLNKTARCWNNFLKSPEPRSHNVHFLRTNSQVKKIIARKWCETISGNFQLSPSGWIAETRQWANQRKCAWFSGPSQGKHES